MWNAGVTEEVRVWSCGNEDGGEVGYLCFVSREEIEVLGLGGVGGVILFLLASQ